LREKAFQCRDPLRSGFFPLTLFRPEVFGFVFQILG
jgi:hypothetical protein